MPPKRKGNGYLEEILKMRRKRNDEAAECGESLNDLPRPSENVFFSFNRGTLHKVDGPALLLGWMSSLDRFSHPVVWVL